MEPFIKRQLFCPGPTPIPQEIALASLDSAIYHRSDDFYKIFLSCSRRLQTIFGSDTQPLILASSGSGAMEAAVVNLTRVDDEVLALNCGKFGERWQKLLQSYKCRTQVLNAEAGQGIYPAQVLAALDKLSKPKALFLQANETSTGVRLPYEAIAAEVKKNYPELLVVVDAISSLGAHPVQMKSMGIDCVVAGSQKGFGMGPGLAFIALSSYAWSKISDRERFYFDLQRERKGQEKGRSAWTPPIGLLQNLDAALTLIDRAGGIDTMTTHHARLGRAARAAVNALGLKIFPGKDFYSDALTAISVPGNLDGIRLLDQLKSKYGAIFAGGQDELKGKILRFAHLGLVSQFDLLHGIAALEFALNDLNWACTLGSGVSAAMCELAAHQSK